MDEEFLDNFFNDLESELQNEQFINELKEHINELNEKELKKLIETHF